MTLYSGSLHGLTGSADGYRSWPAMSERCFLFHLASLHSRLVENSSEINTCFHQEIVFTTSKDQETGKSVNLTSLELVTFLPILKFLPKFKSNGGIPYFV